MSVEAVDNLKRIVGEEIAECFEDNYEDNASCRICRWFKHCSATDSKRNDATGVKE